MCFALGMVAPHGKDITRKSNRPHTNPLIIQMPTRSPAFGLLSKACPCKQARLASMHTFLSLYKAYLFPPSHPPSSPRHVREEVVERLGTPVIPKGGDGDHDARVILLPGVGPWWVGLWHAGLVVLVKLRPLSLDENCGLAPLAGLRPHESQHAHQQHDQQQQPTSAGWPRPSS